MEQLYPDGTINVQWCVAWFDAGAGWWRERGQKKWQRVPGTTFDRPISRFDEYEDE